MISYVTVAHPIFFLFFVAQLKVDDHFKVTQCLKDLLLKDLKSLGGALGLRYTTLDRMTSDSLCEGLVLAWLNQQDNVMKESGKPTWESLMRALRTIDHGGLAQQIAQGKDFMYIAINSHCHFNRSTENSIS